MQNSNLNPQVPSHQIPDSNLSVSLLRDHIDNFMGHRYSLLSVLYQQNQQIVSNSHEKTDRLKLIYESALDKIGNLCQKLACESRCENLDDSSLTRDLTSLEIKKLKSKLKKTEKQIVKIIQESQIQTISLLVEKEELVNQVVTLAKGGLKAKWIHFMALVSKTNQARKAIEAFNNAHQSMIEKSTPTIDVENSINLDTLNEDRQTEIKSGNLHRRDGVIGIQGNYQVQVTFSKNKIKNQIKSFVAQRLSDKERKTINKEITIDDSGVNEKFVSQAIPFNEEFDANLQNRGTSSSVFGSIFGNKGIASANRQEAHLVNGWETNLIYRGKILFQALRHAIISDKHEKNPLIRQKNSKQAAEELLKAALLQELAGQGLTLEKAAQQGLENPIQLNLNSVSIVTPDEVRPIMNRFPRILRLLGLKAQADEKALLHDQISALKSLNGAQTFELDGYQIPVLVKTNSFNFGVNGVSVGYKIGPLKIHLGLKNQYRYNVEAWKEMRLQLKSPIIREIRKEVLDLKIELKALYEENNPLKKQEIEVIRMRLAEIALANKNTRQLINDIGVMMRDRKAYLEGNNQYEIGAKILLLTNTINQTIDLINANKEIGETRMAGLKSAFNCMSGKDRTSIIDAMTKTFAMMTTRNQGLYHSHQEVMNDLQLQEEFRKVFLNLLLKGTGLEITKINTQIKGYKVGEETRIFGMSLKEFLQIEGLSSLI